MKRLLLIFLILLVVLGVAEHLFFSSGISISHLSQETNCPIHSGTIQLERAETLVSVVVNEIGETQESTPSFDLSVEIPHPPTS